MCTIIKACRAYILPSVKNSRREAWNALGLRVLSDKLLYDSYSMFLHLEHLKDASSPHYTSCCGVLQLTHNGGIWGFQTQITVWVDTVDASESDAVVVFSNLSPVIPFGMDGSCSVLSPRDSSRTDLNEDICGDQNGASMTSYVTDRLARIWGMPASYSA